MSEGPRLDAANTNVGLLSDEELYLIYLKALGVPDTTLEVRAKATYDRSSMKRLLTFADAIIYFLAGVAIVNTVSLDNMWLSFPLFIGMAVSLFNTTSGIFALVGRTYTRNIEAQQVQAPLVNTVNLHSPQILAYIAGYLTGPILGNAHVIMKQLQGERMAVERLLEQTRDVPRNLQSERDRLSDPSLLPSYERKLEEANQTVASFERKRDDLWGRINKIQQEISPIERQLQELETLSEASKKLQAIRGFTKDDSVESSREEETAFDNFAGLRARLEEARENLAGIGGGLKAHEDAVAEVESLRLGN